MIENIKQITYRGSLSSCNYKCFYCPFSKSEISKQELLKDKLNLKKFINKLDESNFKERVELLFTPYGEALIHEYYIKAIEELSNKNYIAKVGCQTNLSFDVERFIKLDMDFNKIYLWATFHPTMVCIDEFVSKVCILSKYIKICVGVVGNPNDMDLITKLRKKLPTNIYMWVNKMDGLGRAYTTDEVLVLKKIDPMFMFEVEKFSGYECDENHIFLDGRGNVFNCNRNRKVLGNIYDEFKFEKTTCTQKLCDCYLAYSHIKYFKENKFFGMNNLFRIPCKIEPKAIFFDIDGTLEEDSEILDKTFEYISSKIPIYLATELPEKIAFKKIGFLKKYISGGVFAGGSFIIDYKNNFKHIESLGNLEHKFLEKIRCDKLSSIYSDEDTVYRIIVNEKVIRDMNLSDDFRVVRQNKNMCSIVHKDSDKFFGVTTLCKILKLTLNMSCV